MSPLAGRSCPLVGVAVAVATVALVLAGCGSGQSKRPLSAAQRAAQRAGAQKLARSEAALDRVRSVRITTSLTSTSGQTSRSVADIALPGRMTVSLTIGDQRSVIRLLGGFGYLEANAAYWRAAGAGAPRLLIGRWFAIPDDGLSSYASLKPLLSAETLGRCTLGLPGSTATVTDHHAGTTVLTQRVDGSPPTTDRITLDATAPYRPVSDVRSGPDIADPACGVTTGQTQISSGVVTFSRYDVPVTVTAPPHPSSKADLDRLMSSLS